LQEVWKDILGFGGRYQISNFGRVKSFAGYGHVKCRILKQSTNKYGYKYVTLYGKNGEKKKYHIHRLVATAFLPNPLNLPEVNHKDEQKSHNFSENLEWSTCSDNINYGTHNQRCADSKRKPILQLLPDGTLVKEWGSTDEAARTLGFTQPNINKCLHQKRNLANGYKWQRKILEG
jgi:hypothetical protein